MVPFELFWSTIPILYKFWANTLLKLLKLNLPTKQHSHKETAFLLAPRKPLVACNWAGSGSNSVKKLVLSISTTIYCRSSSIGSYLWTITASLKQHFVWVTSPSSPDKTLDESPVEPGKNIELSIITPQKAFPASFTKDVSRLIEIRWSKAIPSVIRWRIMSLEFLGFLKLKINCFHSKTNHAHKTCLMRSLLQEACMKPVL